MHFSLLEKLGASALICAWLVYGTNFLGNVLVKVPDAASHATVTAGEGKQPAAEATAAPAADLGTLLAATDPAAGEKVFGKCKSCHTIEPGGANKVGPNLYDVVGSPKARVAGFAYSESLLAMAGSPWGYEDLNAFLNNPKQVVPGTKMTFAGLSKAEERAAVIRYLAANAKNPPPLPEPKAPAEAVPAAEKAATTAAASPPPAATAAASPAAVDLPTALAAADPAAGEKVFGKCKSCHGADKGGANKVGPNLWDIIERPKGAHGGFSYSSALAGAGGTWSYKDLDAYLANPKTFIPGNKMTFAGLSKPEERAAVIAWLRMQSDSPQPLP